MHNAIARQTQSATMGLAQNSPVEVAVTRSCWPANRESKAPGELLLADRGL